MLCPCTQHNQSAYTTFSGKNRIFIVSFRFDVFFESVYNLSHANSIMYRLRYNRIARAYLANCIVRTRYTASGPVVNETVGETFLMGFRCQKKLLLLNSCYRRPVVRAETVEIVYFMCDCKMEIKMTSYHG